MSQEVEWVNRLYKPTFDLAVFLNESLQIRPDSTSDKIIQVSLGQSLDNLVHRSSQTNQELWIEKDLVLLRRAYQRKLDDLEQQKASYSDNTLEMLKLEIEELRENWRSAQVDLQNSRLEVNNEKKENERLRIAIEGMKRFAKAQIADADDARWIAQFERQSSQRAFEARMDEKQRDQLLLKLDREHQREFLSRESSRIPSLHDLIKVYRLLEESKAENRRLTQELNDAVSALSEYDRAYKLMIKHVTRQ